VQRSGGVETAGEGDADLLADGQVFKNDGHEWRDLEPSAWLRPFLHSKLRSRC
jgi:hypothetical protein